VIGNTSLILIHAQQDLNQLGEPFGKPASAAQVLVGNNVAKIRAPKPIQTANWILS
jgi:hypothetical protein